MVKVIDFIKRQSGLDRNEFLSYWRSEHTALLRRTPGVRRLCTNVAIAIPGRDPRFDLVAETWWDSVELLIAAQSSPEGISIGESLSSVSAADEKISIIATERVIIPPPNDGSFVKTFVTLYRRPGLSFEEFDRHWAEDHARIVVRLPGFRGYVQCPTLQLPGQSTQVDGCPIAWFDDLAANRAAVRSPGYDLVRADELKFLDQGRLVGIATIEER